MANARAPTVKDIASHLRTLFVDGGARGSTDAAPRFPDHVPPVETVSKLETYLFSVPAEPSSSSGTAGHHHLLHDDVREKEARVLREALLDCWNAITPWSKVPKEGGAGTVKGFKTASSLTAASSGGSDDSAVSAFVVILSTLYTADPSPLPSSDIARIWWEWSLGPLIDPRGRAPLETPQPPSRGRPSSADQPSPQKTSVFAGAGSRGRSTSVSRASVAPPITTPPLSASTPPPPAVGQHSASNTSARPAGLNPTVVRLSRRATGALTNLLVKGATTPGASGATMVANLWDGFVDPDRRTSRTRGRKTRGSDILEAALVRWARAEPRSFFERVSRTLSKAGQSGAQVTATLQVLTLLTSFVRSYPQMTHHLLATPLLPGLIWIVVSPWSASPSPPTSRSLPPPDTPSSPAHPLGQRSDDPEGERGVATQVVASLAMILPRIPTSVEPFLNSLLVALARAACWESEEEEEERVEREEQAKVVPQWDNEDFVGPYGVAIERTPSGPGGQASSAAGKPSTAKSSRPASPSRGHHDRPTAAAAAKANADRADRLPFLTSATELFTVLYGLFPCNLIDFLRDPRGYLDGQGWTGRILMDPIGLRMAVLVSLLSVAHRGGTK